MLLCVCMLLCVVYPFQLDWWYDWNFKVLFVLFRVANKRDEAKEGADDQS